MLNNKFITFLLLSSFFILTTCKKVEKVMMVTTGIVSDTTYYSAKVSGQIIDLGEGATLYGHCYGTTPNVTINGSKTQLFIPTYGAFASQLTGLSLGTEYYIKAYISDGIETVYGKEISFSTLNISDKLVVNNNNDIYSSNIDGSNLIPLTSGSAINIDSRINFSKTKIAFISNRTGSWQIFSMNSDGTGVRQLTTTGVSGNQNNGGAGDVDWTSDDKLLYIKGNKIYKMNSDGSNVIEIATAPTDNWSVLRCSPKGNKIAAQTQAGWAYTETIYIMNIDGSGMTVIAPDLPGIQIVGSFSNDGMRFLYSYDLSGHEESSGLSLNDQIVSVNLDGTGLINLSGNKLDGSNDSAPVYSPDGLKIYFINNVIASNTFYIWLMNADGSNRTKLLDGGPWNEIDCK